MSVIEYMKQDAGGYDIADVRENWIPKLEDAATAALAATRALFDASRARAIAAHLDETFHEVGPFFEAILAERRRLQADTERRADLVHAEWDAYVAASSDRAKQITDTLTSGLDELAVALKREMVPTMTDPAVAVLARQEVEAALRAASAHADASSELPFGTLMAQAERGGEVAAAAASEWGRLTLMALQNGEDTGFALVVEAAARTALNGPDEGPRRAATALLGLSTPRPGEKGGPAANALAYTSFVIAASAAILKTGIVIGIGAAA
jgi:hypothetical protein